MKTYTKKFNAQRAAKSAEKKGQHLEVYQTESGDWGLRMVDAPPKPEPKAEGRDPATLGEVKAVFAEGLRPAKPKKPAGGKRAAIESAAAKGELPEPPDFSAETHKPYRKKLDEVVALVEAGDVEGLRAYPIKPYSTSPKALDRYRNLCVMALTARESGDA